MSKDELMSPEKKPTIKEEPKIIEKKPIKEKNI